jgi:hypothetical protein
MADTKISALADGASVQGSDEFVIARSGSNRKLTWTQLQAYTRSDGIVLALGLWELSRVGSWTTAAESGNPYNSNFYNSSNAQNNAMTWAFPIALSGGTYSMVFTSNKAGTSAIITFETSTDGAAWSSLTTIDCYTASPGVTQITTTGLTIPDLTTHFRVRNPTRNGSATGWYMVFGGPITLARTS